MGWDSGSRYIAKKLTGNALQREDRNGCPPEGHQEGLRVGLWGLMGPSDTYREKQPNHNFPSPLTIVIWALCSVSLFCPQGIGSGPDKTWGQPYMGWSRNAGHPQQGDPPGQTTHSNSLSIQFLFWNFNKNEVCSSAHGCGPSQGGLFSSWPMKPTAPTSAQRTQPSQSWNAEGANSSSTTNSSVPSVADSFW